MNHRILFTWPDLGITARATLADDKNPDLCREVWDSLPLEGLQNHAVVTGGSMYTWVPMLSFAPIQVTQRIDQGRPGDLRYSKNTGQKIAIQYGECNEDIYSPVLGGIDPEDVPKIQQVGRAAWEALFFTKRPIRVRITRADGSSEACGFNSTSTGGTGEVSDLVGTIRAEAGRIITEEPDEHRRIRLGRNAGVGSYGQYFGSWEFTYSMLRDYSMYTLYPIARLARIDEMSIAHLTHVFQAIDPPYTNFLGFCGLRKLQGFAQTFRALLDRGSCTRVDFARIIDALCLYTNMLSSWAYFYFPWGIGVLFRFDEEG
jgi:hypothetical protein